MRTIGRHYWYEATAKTDVAVLAVPDGLLKRASGMVPSGFDLQ